VIERVLRPLRQCALHDADGILMLTAQAVDTGLHAQHFRVIRIGGNGVAQMVGRFVHASSIERLACAHDVLNGGGVKPLHARIHQYS
jgi:hypothetical protein